MANTENKKVATKATANTKSKEDKSMAKKVETKEVAVKEVKNEEKKDVQVSYITIQEATQLYAEAGIKCKNPEAKGNYRIMGGGSSLNIKPKKGYYIYSSNDDFELIQAAKLNAKDLVVEKGTNSQDSTRPNTIICQTVETLKALFKVYATNPKNALVQETAVATK